MRQKGQSPKTSMPEGTTLSNDRDLEAILVQFRHYVKVQAQYVLLVPREHQLLTIYQGGSSRRCLSKKIRLRI